MKRLTRWNEKTEGAELVGYDEIDWAEFMSEDNMDVIDSCNISLAIDKLADYEDAEERLQKHFGANITLIDLLNLFITRIEKEDEEPLKGFRILTNEDAESYDKWKEDRDAEEQGLLLKLPCKVGDTVWFCMEKHYDRYVADEEGEVCSCIVENITIASPYWSFNYGDHEFDPSDFGKTVFLTKEEAEQALKGLEG